MNPARGIAVVLELRHHESRRAARHVFDDDSPVADEGHTMELRSHDTRIGLPMVARGDVVGGVFTTEATANGRHHPGDRLALGRLDIDANETEFAATPKKPGFGHDLFADRRGEVAHLHLRRVKGPRFLAEHGTGNRLPSDRADRCGTPAMQNLPGIRVGILIGKPQSSTRPIQPFEPNA